MVNNIIYFHVSNSFHLNGHVSSRIAIMFRIFITLQKKITIIGIAPNQHPINVFSLSSLFVQCLTITSCGAYFFIEASSFQEYAESIFVSTALIATTSIFILDLSKMRPFFECINEAERIIESSKNQNISK